MIRLQESSRRLDALESFGLEVLIDLSRLLVLEGSQHPTLELGVVDTHRAPSVLADPSKSLSEGLRISDSKVIVSRALIRQVGEIAGGISEQLSAERDQIGRIPSNVNPLVRSGRHEHSVVGTIAGALRETVRQASASGDFWSVAPWPGGKRWAVAMTHDLDVVGMWPVMSLIRVLELARSRRITSAGRTLVRGIRSLSKDPVESTVSRIIRDEASMTVPSTWFIIAERPTLRSVFERDVTYDLREPRVRTILERIVDAGHEVGLHGSFRTLTDREALLLQRSRLQDATGQAVTGARQHFLRFIPGTTASDMLQAGFDYDSSIGFVDRGGFRLGTGDVLRSWHVETGRSLDLEECPLTWMDRSSSKYQRVEDPDAWVDSGLALAAECRRVEGLWVGLWHPYLADELGFPGAGLAFKRLLDALRSDDPYFGSLESIVAWRRIRRSVRACAVTPQGLPVVFAKAPAGTQVVLEDREGRAHSVSTMAPLR
jgi:hypothetical protein